MQVRHSHICFVGLALLTAGGLELGLDGEGEGLVFGESSDTSRLTGRFEFGLVGRAGLDAAGIGGADLVPLEDHGLVEAVGDISPPPFPVGFSAEGGM